VDEPRESPNARDTLNRAVEEIRRLAAIREAWVVRL
jgi:hypothetical protein